MAANITAADATRLPAEQLAFEHLGAEQGLSQQVIRCIEQDRTGYMWFGTQDGLNKYDGYTFTVYRHDADDPHSLPNNSVAAIHEDRDGTLWIGTSGGGLSRFNPETDNFRNFQYDQGNPTGLSDNAVSFIYEDRSGILWIGTEHGGLNKLDVYKKRFTHYRHDTADPQSLGEDDVRAMWQDHTGIFWLGTRRSGLDRFDPETQHFAHFRSEPRNPQSLSNNEIHSIYEDNTGTLWIGTGNGLNKFDRVAEQFHRYQNDPERASSAELTLYSLFGDASGGFWMGTGNGLEKYDGQSGFIRYRHDSFDPHALTGNIVFSIYEDRSGNLWVGTEGGGLNRYNPKNWRFTTYRRHPGNPNSLNSSMVTAVYEDRGGTLWIGTDEGLTAYDRQSPTPTKYQHKPGVSASLSGDYISAISEDAAGLLWVGTHDGLDCFDRHTKRFTQYRHDSANPRSLSDDVVFFIYQDKRGTLWIGTQRGLNKFERQSGGFTHYQHDPLSPGSLGENDVRAIAEDEYGVLWIGTRHAGLDRFDPLQGVFSHYRHEQRDVQTISSNAVYSLLVGQDRQLWIGTTEGINLFDRLHGTFSRITEKDGLPNNTIYSIFDDRDGHLWVSTDKGLSELNRGTRAFRNYDINDGLQGNEFNGGAGFKSTSGELFFGGINGLNTFYPERLKDSSYQAPIVITAFKALDRRIIGFGGTNKVRLSYRDYVLSAEFAALDYAAPQKNRYAYKLEGLDRNWTYSGPRRIAIYTNLNPGNYILRVKGTNSDGVWSAREATLSIEVIPPFWRRWWFLAVMTAAIGNLTAWAYKRRISALQRARIAQENFSRRLIESQELERKRIAAELHDGLGQNLLVIKNHALLGLATGEDQGKALAQLSEISSTASLALDEVREIARALRPYQLDRLGLTKALESILKRAASSSPIKFSAQIDTIDKLFSKEDDINLYRIMQESVNNVLKHSQATEASVVIAREPRRVVIKVQDNGMGFQPDSPGGVAKDEAGFGLTGIAERARILGAKHYIYSVPGQGTKIVLEIPLHDEYPDR